MSSIPASLEKKLRRATLGVWYRPLADEPDPRRLPFPNDMRDLCVFIPASAATNPVVFARDLSRRYKTKVAYVLVPGRAFDLRGGRRGRGGGWFDRFLATIPSSWLRIGIATRSHVATQKIPRQAWDQPMDWLFIEDEDGAWTAVYVSGRRGTHSDKNRYTDQ